MIDASTDPDYCKAFDDLTREVQGGASSPDVEAIVEAERRYFMSRVDDIVLRIIFHQVRSSINQSVKQSIYQSNAELFVPIARPLLGHYLKRTFRISNIFIISMVEEISVTKTVVIQDVAGTTVLWNLIRGDVCIYLDKMYQGKTCISRSQTICI